MLNSDDLMAVIVGVKFIHALVKHKASFLLDNSLFDCLDLMAKFPWANILHNVVVNVIMYVFSNEEESLIKSFLDTNILRKIIVGLSQLGEIGYRPHLRMVAFAMRNSNSIMAQEIFNNDPLWSKFWIIMQARDEREWTFKQAEDKVRTDLNALLNGTYEPTLPMLSQEVDSFSETPDDFNETSSTIGDPEIMHNQESVDSTQAINENIIAEKLDEHIDSSEEIKKEDIVLDEIRQSDASTESLLPETSQVDSNVESHSVNTNGTTY